MKVTVTEKSPVERTMEITVESKVVDNAYEKAFKKVQKQLALPGFRKGKVPSNLARKYIRDDGLTGDVLESLVPQYYREALDKENLVPISEPAWDFVQKERGKELIFKVTFEVKPILEISGYEDLEITQERREVTDEEVEGTIDNLLRSHASVVPVEEKRGLQEGDLALVDYSSREGDTPLPGGSAENYLMEMQPDHYIPGFLENLYGLEAGQDKDFEIQFPEDYENPDLAGKLVGFTFSLKDIKQRQLPEADDEFAKTVSSFETMDALRQDIREKLERNYERRAREQAAAQIVGKLLEQVPADRVPRALHSYRTNLEMRRILQELHGHGMDLDGWLSSRGLSKQQWVAELSAVGMFEARIELIVDGVAHAEKLSVPNEEVDGILETEARSRRIAPEALRARMQEDGSIELLKYNMLRAKVQDLLVDKAAVTYVPPGEGETEEETEKTKPTKSKTKKTASKSAKSKKGSEEKEDQAKKAVTREKAKKSSKARGTEEKKAKPAAKAKKKAAAKKKKE